MRKHDKNQTLFYRCKKYTRQITHLEKKVTWVIAITVCKVIQELITKVDFWYQTDLLGSFVHVCLVPKIYFSS